MSIFSRLFKIGEAKANQVVDGMEKPELMLEQAIRDKQKQIAEAKKAIQQCIATERQTKALLQKEKSDKSMWEQRAEQALGSGNEELAIKALGRAKEHETRSISLEPQWNQQRSDVDKLKQDIMKLDEQVQEYKRNKDYIIAQSKAAEVKKQIYEAKAKISGGKHGADDLMARMKAKAERSAHEAEAAEELAETFTGDSLESEFKQLGSTGADADVQNKLAAMKARLASKN